MSQDQGQAFPPLPDGVSAVVYQDGEPASYEGDRPPPHERGWRLPWQPEFLRSLSVIPDVSAACRAARIDRRWAYDVRDQDPEFRAAWLESRESALDDTEREIWRRGRMGTPRTRTVTTLVEKRDKAGAVVESVTTTTTIQETVLSTGALIAYMKAYRPEKWRERFDIRTGQIDPATEMEDRLDAAVGEFDASVTRLSDARRARGVAVGNGTPG